MGVLETKNQKTPESIYFEAEVRRYKIEDATIGVRVFGQGPAVALIHGYPVHGYTWRKLLPELFLDFTCYVVDLLGFGDSDWTSNDTRTSRRFYVLLDCRKIKFKKMI
ncbi:MAG: alpha/beta fold hydrolase [Cellvibrionaceae bacterium]